MYAVQTVCYVSISFLRSFSWKLQSISQVVLFVVLTIFIGKTEPKQNKPSLLSKFIVSLIRDLKEKTWKQ